MDMQMPVMGGAEAVELLRAAGCQTPIAALTANAMKGDRENYSRIGCNDFLASPSGNHVFYQVLANTCPSVRRSSWPQGRQLDRTGRGVPGPASRILASLDGYLARLRQAMARDDHAEVREQAHQLKGLGGLVRLPGNHRTRHPLEAALKAGRYDEGKTLGDSLCELLEECGPSKPI